LAFVVTPSGNGWYLVCSHQPTPAKNYAEHYAKQCTEQAATLPSGDWVIDSGEAVGSKGGAGSPAGGSRATSTTAAE
jgi:hypothetical protein